MGKRGRPPVVSDDAVVAAIREILAAAPEESFYGEGYRKIWARLRMKGVVADKDRVRRLMGEHDLLAPTRTGKPRGPRAHDGSIIPLMPNVMWGTDATAAWTSEQGQVTVFAVMDHHTGECLGIHAAKYGNRHEALEPIRQAVKSVYGGYDYQVTAGLLVRHDHGSQYMSKDFQKELRFLGAVSSPSFVRCPEGNGVIERFFRTLKEQLLWQHHWKNEEELREALLTFKARYNANWILQRHGYRTPNQVREAWNQQLAMAA